MLVLVLERKTKSRDERDVGDVVSNVLAFSREYPKDARPVTLVCDAPGVNVVSGKCNDKRGLGPEDTESFAYSESS